MFIKVQTKNSSSNNKSNIIELNIANSESKLPDKDEKLEILKSELNKAKLAKNIPLIEKYRKKIRNRKWALRQYRKAKL